MLQALETDENAARAMQHDQKKAVHWEPWQSPVKMRTTTVKIAKPINPNAVRTLLALQEQATRTGTPKSNAKSNEKSELAKAAPPATRRRKWEFESRKTRSRRNLRRMKVKTRERRMTVMPAMKASPKQLQPKDRSGRMSHTRRRPMTNGRPHQGLFVHFMSLEERKYLTN